jgi:uncharacterized protein (TIGR02646 family)
MRYINLSSLEEQENWPSKEWLDRVRKAEEELKNLPVGKTRADIFRKYHDIWSVLKEDYKKLSYNKCWYCEVDTDGMHGDMDHHRPKGKVTENPEHPGYWWLAFNWHNFRFSCERCNSLDTDPITKVVGGKQNYFPLVNDDESCRIQNECDYGELFSEYPLLLDPTEPDDPQLLTFQPDGRPGPTNNDEKSIAYQRVQGSIKIYNLHHSVSNRSRRKIYNRVRDLVACHQRYILMLETDYSDLAARAGMKQVLTELRSIVTSSAPYSSAARAYLDMHKQNGPAWSWINGLLLTGS